MLEPGGGAIGVRTRRRSFRCENRKRSYRCQNQEEEFYMSELGGGVIGV